MDSSFSFVQCLCSNAVVISCCQSLFLLVVRCTLKVLVLICQPKIILISEGKPSAKCLILLMMSDLLVASCGDGGLKRHSKAMGTACVRRRGILPIAAPAMKISSMKLSATMSLGGVGPRVGQLLQMGCWVMLRWEWHLRRGSLLVG